MKEFRKNQDGLFICEECNQLFKKRKSLFYHIKRYGKKEYFDKWLKEETDGLCKICGKETIFDTHISNYKNGCCKKHIYLYADLCRKKTNLKIYGVEYSLQSKNVREKGKQTKKEKYGNENYCNVEKSKQTCLKNHGVENISQLEEIKKKKEETCLKNHGVRYMLQSKEGQQNFKNTLLEKTGYDHNFKIPDVIEKRKQTWLKNLGVDHPGKSSEVHKKTEKSNLKKYKVENVFQRGDIIEKCKNIHIKRFGVDNPMQNREIHEKAPKSALKLKPYLNTDLYYQGTYELDFLDNHYEKFKDNISRALSIKYTFDEKNKVHHPDFYIKTLNLIVECKNSYLYKRDKDVILAKRDAAISQGYNYIIIIDKDYTEFNEYISK